MRKHKFRQIHQLQKQDEDTDFDTFEEGMLEEIDKLEDDLMRVEMKLSETLQLATQNFQERVKKIIDDMKQKTV